MCMAVPGRLVSVCAGEGGRTGEVDFRGMRREVLLEYVPEAVVGDWVLVHLGLAIQCLDEQTALETLALFEEAGLLDEDVAGA